jgi:aryl-alcohol dehydrogenase-like predicted oxidoreductase
VELGVTLFDTADMYSDGASEVITGRLLSRLFARREDYVLATKVFYPTGPGPNDRGLSRKHLFAAVDASLKRLRTEYVDLYQIHRFDPETPVEETVQALDDIVRAGKARYVGASAMYGGWARFVAMQNRYNLVNREDERELIPLCRDLGVGVIPYSPLARGLLAGTRERTGESRTARGSASVGNDRPADFDVLDVVRVIAQRRGVPPASVSLAWLLSQPGVTAPIIGATSESHIHDATTALMIALEDTEAADLARPYVARLMSDY